MPRYRRSRIEVIRDILHEARKGANKTRIMYRSNLNFACFNRYFEELIKKGLIVEVKSNPSDGTKIYKTSEKGLQLLEVLEKAKDLISV
ncbi:DNA-binding protein [Candidatus Bathyarchaeota archaeon]|nr:MAG: DNA-binding protein [Candidatus Bathyarchaeota archaeon]